MVSYDNQQQNLRLEYELIHKTRMDWVSNMMIWRTITIPLSLTLIGLLASLNREPNLWFVGWLLGILLLFFWRAMESHIELQIRGLYTRIITLEQQLGITFFFIIYGSTLKIETMYKNFKMVILII
jgi:hypothetical protein